MNEIVPDEGLQEKDFIHEGYSKNPRPFWGWLFAISALAALFWGLGSWYYQKMTVEIADNPFLQVTNRELSVFLWQFPQYMPQHVKDKTGYLPGFEYTDRIGIIPDKAEDYVSAPPPLLFLYHTWSRLLKDEFTQRPIPKEEFIRFLKLMPEWTTQYWRGAPKAYVDLVKDLPNAPVQDLATLPDASLPTMVRMAFQGWKNYFIEGDKINSTFPTYSEMEEFIKSHPHYARNFWRNIVMDDYPKYLFTLTYGRHQSKESVPNDEISPFLKVAFFNYLQSLREKLGAAKVESVEKTEKVNKPAAEVGVHL